ncbi:hypothetical protein LAZ67_9001617, partial [Cordylochernes scorpioides]
MVIGLKRAGWSIRQIAADTHLGASTVHRLWRRWLEQGNVAIYRNVGATRVTSARVDRRILRQAVAAPQATCTAILQHAQDTLDHSISTRTISRRLVANGLHSCRPLRRLPLTPPNRRQRLEWCRARSTWMTEWHRVVFSNESRFCLSSDSRRVRVWRRRGERSNPAAIVERPTVRQRGIMVWGAIAYDSRSPLLRIQGTMTAQRYVDDVLRPVTLPYLQGVPNALYQQDNARPHTARISQQALQDVQMLPWPPYSPDLSPIEHVWDIIGRRLYALPQPRSEDELWQMVEREWRPIPQDAIRTLIDSLPRRVAACIAVRDRGHIDIMAWKDGVTALMSLDMGRRDHCPDVTGMGGRSHCPDATGHGREESFPCCHWAWDEKMANNLTSPLPLNLNATDLYSEYKHWMNSYLIYELASGVSTKKDDVKRATLLHCLGPQVQRIFFNLPEEKDTYEKAKEALTKYFTPQKNIVSERFKFRQRKQNTDENIDSYVIALRELVKSCEFGNLEEDMIRDQIIEKCYNRQLKEKLLQQDNLNLQRTIEISRMFETAKEEFRVLTNEDMTSINRVNYKNNFQAANESTVKGPKAHNVYHQKGSTSKVSAPNLEECYRCGLTTHPPYKCGARNMKCTFCNKMGHLNRVCRNKNKYKNIEGKKRNIQNISENNEDSDEYTFFLGSDNKESIYIDGKEITMTIDTGSDTTFIGLENLKNIFPKSQMPTLNGTERKFYAYGQTSPLPCCGYFFADVSWGERSIKEQIFVIEGKAEPLLGKKASFELEIIKRGTKIRNIQQEVIPKDIYNLMQENMNLFQGQGNVKGYSQKITLKENVTPVAQRCRHFPYKMVEAINQELDKMIEDGIFEEVHEASEWISNIVAVPKKGTEEIRLCVDLKEVMEHNQAYKERMKKYADSKNKALPHDFKKGNIVYVANTEMKSKLTPNYDNQRFIILETISPNSFKLVNTETGSFIIRNAKHLRHANVLQDFNKGIDLNTTLIKTPEIRMELPSTSRYLPEQEATLEDIVPEEQIAISDMDCLYPNESPNENENKTVITRSGRQIH